jgi:hypothetical protein
VYSLYPEAELKASGDGTPCSEGGESRKISPGSQLPSREHISKNADSLPPTYICEKCCFQNVECIWLETCVSSQHICWSCRGFKIYDIARTPYQHLHSEHNGVRAEAHAAAAAAPVPRDPAAELNYAERRGAMYRFCAELPAPCLQPPGRSGVVQESAGSRSRRRWSILSKAQSTAPSMVQWMM